MATSTCVNANACNLIVKRDPFAEYDFPSKDLKPFGVTDMRRRRKSGGGVDTLADPSGPPLTRLSPRADPARGRVDPVYEALRYGTSLAQMGRTSFGSLSESPTRGAAPCGEEGGVSYAGAPRLVPPSFLWRRYPCDLKPRAVSKNTPSKLSLIFSRRLLEEILIFPCL